MTPEQKALVEYIQSGATATIAQLAAFNLESGTFYGWPGEYELTAGGRTWQPTYGRVGFDDVSLGEDAHFTESSFSIFAGDEIDELLKLVATDFAQEARSRGVTRYWTVLDADAQPIGPVTAISSMIMDSMSLEAAPGRMSIKITTEGPLAVQKPLPIYYTDLDLKRRFPDARGAEAASSMPGNKPKFPVYS